MRLAALAAACCLLLVACEGQRPTAAGRDDQIEGTRTLTVYVSMPLHGPSGTAGRDAVEAIKLALAETGGTVGPFQLNLVSLDSATPQAGSWEDDRVLDNARRAISDLSVIAYIGELHSGASAISIPVLNEAGVLMVSPSSTYVGLTREGGLGRAEPERFYPSGERTFARVVPADDVQAGAQVEVMGRQGVSRLFVLHDGGLYGRGLAEQVERAARREGIEILAVEEASDDPTDARGVARQVLEAEPDGVLYSGDLASNPRAILTAVTARAPDIPLFAPDAVATAPFLNGLDERVERRLLLTSPAMQDQRRSPAGRRFEERFLATFGRAPEPSAAFAYEAMQAVVAAIDRAGQQGNDRAAVIEQFLGLDRRDTVLGDYAIDLNGDTSLTRYGAYRIRDGRLVLERLLRVPT